MTLLAVGTNLPDALSGAALAGRIGAPLYITRTECVPTPVKSSVTTLGAAKRVAHGSAVSVSDDAAANLGCLVGAAPRIMGTARVGETLSSVAPVSDWTPGTMLSYRWSAGGAPIAGQTGQTLTLTDAQRGKMITLEVTGTLSGYVTSSFTSSVVGAVAAAVAVPTIPGNPGNSVNCTDFSTWAAANAWYLRYFPYYGDVARLDQVNDGIPCEELR